MYRKRNRAQISIDDFIPPFGGKLSAENRWVKLSRVIPWDQIEERYAAQFGNTVGFCPVYSNSTYLHPQNPDRLLEMNFIPEGALYSLIISSRLLV